MFTNTQAESSSNTSIHSYFKQVQPFIKHQTKTLITQNSVYSDLNLDRDMGQDIEKLISAGNVRRESYSDGFLKPLMKKDMATCRVLVMGGSKVGKSSLIAQLLQEKIPPQNKSTFHKMHQTIIRNHNKDFIPNIEEISRTFASDFPVMFELSVAATDALVLVYMFSSEEKYN